MENSANNGKQCKQWKTVQTMVNSANNGKQCKQWKTVQTMENSNNITSFYGSTCANNGALNTPETLERKQHTSS
eukprot:1108378-Pyramimonas_sp.AAC.1